MSLRLAIRALLKSPGYTAIALLTLALGIGVNTSMFSVTDALLFRRAPFPDADRLVQIVATTRQGESRAFSAIELREIREQTKAFAGLATIGQSFFAISQPGEPAQRIGGTLVSEEMFATFRVQPMLGRAFTREEFQPGRNQVVILSYAWWQQHFGGARDILGRTLRLDGENVTVVGVMPPSFDYRMLWGWCALWRPLNFTKEQLDWRDYRVFNLIGRLGAGGTPAQATAELAPLAATQEKLHPESYSGLRYRAIPLHESLMDRVGRRISLLLLALSGFVLLIACANLANLQLARATANIRDVAIRAALGASRARLIVHQLVESVVLALGGGGVGLLLAWALNRAITSALGWSDAGQQVALDPSILAITLLVSVLTGVFFGIVPAWLVARTDVNTALKQQSRGGTAGRAHHRMRHTLIVTEVALALVLLGGAAILQRGFVRLLQRDAGWDTDRILTATVPVPETRIGTDAKRVELYRKIEARLTALPGVEHAAIATSLPLFSYNGDRQVLTEGQSPGDSARLPAAFHVMVTSDYFATMGIRLVEGRLFPADIKPSDPRVIVINEALARRLWPGRSAIGQRLGSMDSGIAFWAEVIGVVRDVDMVASLADPSTPFEVYKPLVQEPWGWVNVVVRAPAPAALIESLRRAIAEVDPDLALDRIGTVRQIVDEQQHNLVLAAKTLTAFAALGLLLAAIGLYGVISHLVAQRTTEFGIRLALGARPGDVLRLVVGHGLRLAGIGIVFGVAGTWIVSRLLGAVMPRLASVDPLALATVSVVLFAVAGLACWLPARRATRVDPMIALRAE